MKAEGDFIRWQAVICDLIAHIIEKVFHLWSAVTVLQLQMALRTRLMFVFEVFSCEATEDREAVVVACGFVT